MKDMLIACIDGLKGFSEAIESVYPDINLQLCIVQMVRNSVRIVSWKDRKNHCGFEKCLPHGYRKKPKDNSIDLRPNGTAKIQ